MSAVALASVGGQMVGGQMVGGQMVGGEPPGQEAGPVMLRVSGGRPLRLRGHLLAEASSWSPGAPVWHEIALYRCDNDEIAAALRLRTQPDGAGDLCQARRFAALAEAADWLAGINPTADLATDLDASDRRLSGVEIALRAAALRQRADRVQRQYQTMIGELLFCIAGGEPAGCAI